MQKSNSVGSDELVAWKAFVSQGHPNNRESTLGITKTIVFPEAPQVGQILPVNENNTNENAMMIVGDHFPHDGMRADAHELVGGYVHDDTRSAEGIGPTLFTAYRISMSFN